MGRFRLLADEHVPRIFVTVLKSNGFEIETVQERFGQRTDDAQILEFCSRADRVVLTNDRDFLKLAGAVDHAGVILYSDWSVLLDNPQAATKAIGDIARAYPDGDLSNRVEWLEGWIPDSNE